MENEVLKLNAPKAIKARYSINRKTKSDLPISHLPLMNEFEFLAKDSFFKISKNLNLDEESENSDSNDIKKDFDELSIKSEILSILHSNEKYNNKINSNCSRSTALSTKNLSNDFIQEDEFSLPPIRTKNPFSHKLNDLYCEEEDKNYHINFSKFLKKS